MSNQPVIIGVGSAPASTDDVAIDEFAFAAAADALRDAGVTKSDVDLSLVASIDVYDGQSMSNGITTPAAGGWLAHEYRLENDSGVALIAAAAAIKAGDAEIALVVGLHWPATDADPLRFDAEATSLCFEPQYERPLGISAASLVGLHAAHQIASGTTTLDALGQTTVRELGRRGVTVDVAEVFAAEPVAWPLTRLMLPEVETAAVGIVLASPQRARLCRRRRAVIAGHGISNGGALSTNEWLTEPDASTRRAAQQAYARAGLDDPGEMIDVVELTAPSAALIGPMRTALGVAELDDRLINPGCGALGGSAGAATGAVRVADALHWLDHYGHAGSRAVAHSVDGLTGTVAATTTVHVLERIS